MRGREIYVENKNTWKCIEPVRNGMKSILDGINRVAKEEDRITDIEDGVAKDTQSEWQQEERIRNNEDNIRSLWDNIKCNTCIIEVPEEEEQEIENLFEEIMMENFPNLVKEIDIQPQGTQRVPRTRNPKRHTPKYIIIKMPKVKDKENLKSSKKKALK